MPKLNESRKGIAEILIHLIGTEVAKSARWEVKYNSIVKSNETKQFVAAFYTDIHVKKIPGNFPRTEEVHQSSSSGGSTKTQEPVKQQYSEAASKASGAGSSARATSTTRGVGRPKKSGPTGGALSK